MLGTIVPSSSIMLIENERGTLGTASGFEALLRERDIHRKSPIRRLVESGELGVVCPELYRLSGVPQSAEFHRDFDVLTHSIAALEFLSGDSPIEILLAALFHDVGKRDKKLEIETTRVSFRDHEYHGAEMTRDVCARLGFPQRVVDAVYNMIALHMVPTRYEQAVIAVNHRPNPTKWLRPLAVLGETEFEQFMKFHEADLRGRDVELKGIEKRLQTIRSFRDEVRKEQKSGFFIMSPSELRQLGWPLNKRDEHRALLDAVLRRDFVGMKPMLEWLKTHWEPRLKVTHA